MTFSREVARLLCTVKESYKALIAILVSDLSYLKCIMIDSESSSLIICK